MSSEIVEICISRGILLCVLPTFHKLAVLQVVVFWFDYTEVLQSTCKVSGEAFLAFSRWRGCISGKLLAKTQWSAKLVWTVLTEHENAAAALNGDFLVFCEHHFVSSHDKRQSQFCVTCKLFWNLDLCGISYMRVGTGRGISVVEPSLRLYTNVQSKESMKPVVMYSGETTHSFLGHPVTTPTGFL